MTSLAHTPGRTRPVRSIRTTSGTFTRTSRVYQAAAMSVAPTPNANAPTAPLLHVWLSVPTTTSPGRATFSTRYVWQIASLLPDTPGPMNRPPLRAAKSCWRVLRSSTRAISSAPPGRRASILGASDR
jgi:hypothetical protein